MVIVFSHLAKRLVSIVLTLQRMRALIAPCAAGMALLSTGAPARAQSVPAVAATATPPPEIGRVSTSDRQDEPADATARPA